MVNMNDIKKIGVFIQQLRKEQNMTQKELALQLNITDKAVSKWERGLSCPDISLLIPLSELLGASTSELLNGERTVTPPPVETETIVKEALVYSGRHAKLKTEKIKRITLLLLSAACLIAATVCLICDYCITGRLTWSPIVIVSLIFSWLTLLPLFLAKKKPLKISLIILCILILPYLWTLSHILHIPEIFQLGFGISLISIAGIWCIYAVFIKHVHRKLLASGIVLLILIPMTIGINQIITMYTHQIMTGTINNMINIVSILFLSIICFTADYIKKHKAS